MAKQAINFELFREACAIVDGVPDRRFKLRVVSDNRRARKHDIDPNHCGTVGCAMGWLGMHSRFAGLMKTTSDGDFLVPGREYPFVGYSMAASLTFGMSCDDASTLFRPSFHFGDISDKTVFRRRVRDFLQSHNQPVSAEWLAKC